MDVILTEPAAADLVELRAYLGPRSPAGLRHVTDRIAATIRSISDQPRRGKPSSRDGVRVVLEPRFSFEIPYVVLDGKIYVLRIYRTRREPLDYEALRLP